MDRRDGLTVEQSKAVREALPELHRLARCLARKCPNQTLDELETLAEDSLMRRVRRWDPERGRLIDFARKGVRRDVIRAAYAGANDPCLGGAFHAMDEHEDGIAVPDTATRWAEGVEEKEARALTLGQDQAAAGFYGYSAVRARETPEDEFGSREAFVAMKQVVADSEPRVSALFDLLFEQDMSWREAAERLGIHERQAYRIADRPLSRLRAMLAPRQVQAP